QGAGPIWLDDVICTGKERDFFRCAHRTWGDHNCQHAEDAAVVCAGEPGQVRLAGGPGRCVGRVEVLHLGRWGTVCDDTWDLRAARVTCRHLGCGPALSAPGGARFGPGHDPVWLDQVSCSGEELTLDRCELRQWGEHDCGHEEDAGVVCAGEQRQVCAGVNRCVQVS
ncbi:DMBT1 protein, partial [Poecile atricapillus]|nr:DMBT1 protein [Poecile atricapillus]